ncbi:MAG TPA: asparagine synthase (glutamine-hydrolyzing) [Bacteroidota bacterium]
MCGIVGLVNINQGAIDGNVLETMTSSLSHRGPDGTGIEMRKQVGFGHRRLAIIDPEGGRQPLFNEDGQVWVTFNGEIYNFKELRRELESNGHRFKTNVDSEVIVHGYEQWGERCVEHFRGMFAFAVMDWRERKVFLARDHFGIKPLYYVQTGDHFAFASEMHALRYVPDLNVSLDLTAIDEYLWLQYIPAPHTVFDKIYKLLPAHSLSIRLDGKTQGPVEYWRIEFNPDHTLTEGEWIERLDEVIADSVKAHLVSDVPFGAFLSGGVDSSLVVAHMTQALGRPVSTFSIGFEEGELNEDRFARQASARWGTNHHMEIVQPDALAILPELVRHYGEPFGDSSAIPTFYVSQVARKHVPMVLSGDGADELFAGYWSYGHWLSSLWQSASTPDGAHRGATLSDWLVHVNYINPAQRSSLWKPDLASVCPSPLERMKWEFGRTRELSACNKAQYMDMKSYLPYDILTKVDIASMMHGLEVRTPFVDVRVAECAARIPEVLNIGSPDGKEWNRKLLLKKVAEKYYPKAFLHRPKMGFAMPLAKWFHSTGHLHAEVRERLLGKNSSLSEFFNAKPMSSLLSQNAHGPAWVLLFLEEWLRANKGFIPQKRNIPEIQTSMREETIALPQRPRVMFITDYPGSTVTKGCAQVIQHLQERFECSIAYKTQLYFESEYDLVVSLDRSLVVDERVQTSGKHLIVRREDLFKEEASLVAAKLWQIFEKSLSPGDTSISQTERAEDVTATADGLFSAGRFEEARDKLLEALTIQPDDAALILSLGNLYFQMGEMASARKEFQKVTYLFPDNSSGHSNLAAVYVQEGETSRAEQSLRKALELQPDDANALHCLARLYLDDRQYERSLTIFDKFLALRPDDIDARFSVAAVHFEAGRIEAARQMLKEVLRYQPDNTAALETLEKINTKTPHVQPRDNSTETIDMPIRVLIFYDEKGWAWWHRAHHIKNNISKDIQIDTVKIGTQFDHHQHDFLLLFDHYLLPHIGKVPSEKIIIGNSCPRILAESIKVVMEGKCAGGVVNNLVGYQRALEYTDKYFCCQNGVDERLFYPAEKKVKELIACWVGNSKSMGNKGLELIEQACQQSGVRLRIVDAADKEQGVEANPQEWVRDQLYHKSSVYVCASEFEGAPNPALEAMACGLPVISTRVGNMVELIKDGYNGFLVERSPEAIAAALQKLRKSDFHTMGKNARTSIENGWTWVQQVTKYETMFKELKKHPQPEVDQILAQVQELREQDEHGRGLRMLEDALRHDPHDEKLLVAYAELLLESGAREKAKNTLLQLLEHHPNSLDGMNNLAVIEIMDGEMSMAKGLLEKVLQADPENKSATDSLRYLASLQEHGSPPKEEDTPKTEETLKPKAKQAYARAQRLIEAGKFDEAIGALQALLKIIPGHAQAMNDLGALFFAQGNLQEAREYLDNARDIDSSNVVTLKNLAELATHEDRLDEAAACYQEILDVDPQDLEALVAVGMIALAIKRYDNAAVFFTRALEVDPENIEALKGLEAIRADPVVDITLLEERAKSLAAENKIEEAIEVFRQITEQEPQSSDAHYNLGLCYCKLQQRSQAIDALVKAVELDPKNPTTAKTLAHLLVEEEMYEEGIRLLTSILRYAPEDVETVLSLAQLYDQAGRGNDASVFYERVLALDPENAEAQTYLHVPELALPEQAEPSIQRDPEVQALMRRAEQKFDAGDFVGARDELVAAINLAPYDAELLTISGNVHLKLGELQQAAGIYARAAQVDPFFAPAHYSLALLLREGSPAQAVSSARRVLDIDSTHVGASKVLVEALMGEKKHAESIPALFSYLRHAESDTGTMLGLARAYQELGDTASARSLYETVLKIAPGHAGARDALGSIKEKPRVKKSKTSNVAHHEAKLYLAMLTHNAFTYTKKSLESIERTTDVPYKVIVVDNASTDETPTWLSQQDNPHLYYELSDTNLGVPGGRNRLLEIALRDLPGDGFIIFVDNDMEFFPGWAGHYLDFFDRHPEAGIVSAVGHRFIVKRDKRELLPKPLRADTVDVACGGYGCCMRAAVVKAVGDFDTQLGLFWHEDDDYSVRAIEKGFEVYTLPSAPIFHHGHKSGIAEGGSLKNQRYLTRKWRTMGMVDGRGRIDHSRVQPSERTTRVIGVDARTFSNIDSITRGIGHYSLYHLTALAEEKPDWQFILYSVSEEVPEVLEKLCSRPNVTLRPVTTFKSEEVDLVHLCDPMDVTGCSPFKVFQNVRTTVTFYDLIPLKMYISHWSEQVRKAYLARLKELAENDTRLLAISDFTKKDLIAQTQIDPARIETIMAGINSSPGRGRTSKSKVQTVLSRYGITKPFFLHVGALDLHKNFDSVLRAFLECSKQNEVQLVVAGRLQNFVKVYADYVKTQKIKNVFFTDFISGEDLEVLYSKAVALVFASLHEGFGFPVLEAMANGCPVISSNASSIPEVAGDAAILFDPKDVRNISKAMNELLQNPQRRDEMKTKGREQSAKFTWKHTAQKTIAVWNELLGPTKTKRKQPKVAGDLAEICFSAALDYSGYSFLARSCAEVLMRDGVEVSFEVLAESEDFEKSLVRDPDASAMWKSLTECGPGAGLKVCVHPPTLWNGTDFYAEFRRKAPGFKKYIGLTMFETDRLPQGWADSCNEMDEIWVPSTFNQQTFVLGGVEKNRVKVLPLGLDVHKYNPEEVTAMKIKRKKGFTFLSVFQWSDRKGWDVLLSAYLSAFNQKDDVSLVLRTYRSHGSNTSVKDEVHRFVLAAGYDPQCIPSIIVLDEFIDEADMPSLYRAADAYVMPTRGEGWGIPFMEAMAMGLPAIGTKWGGHLDFMNDDNSFLIDIDGLASVSARQTQENPFYGQDHCWVEPSIEHTADLMRHVFDDREDGAAKGLKARSDIIANWSMDRTVAWLKDRMGVDHTSTHVQEKVVLSVDTHEPKPTGVPLLWHAPVFNPSGYAEEARNFVLQLEASGNPVALRSISAHSQSFYDGYDEQARNILDGSLSRMIGSNHINIIHFPAYAFEKLPSAAYNIGRTMFETDSLPEEWVRGCNAMDEIWVPSDFNMETFRNAGVRSKLVKIPGGVDTWHFRDGLLPLEIPGVRGTVFLSIFEWIYRKGWDVLLKAWARAFTAKDDVCLVLRAYPMNSADHASSANEIESRIKKFIRGQGLRRNALAPIVVIGDQIAENDMPRLYAAASAYVAPSRGEGWGRPQMEAMACGLPVIATRWSGNLEFMNDDNSLLLDAQGLVTIDDKCEIPFYRGQRWAEPSVKHLVHLLQQVVQAPEEMEKLGVRARQDMEAHWRWEDVTRKVRQRLREIQGGASQDQRVAVTTGPPSIRWEGSQFVHHSLAVINRNVCSRLISSGYPVSIIPYEPDEFKPEGDAFAAIAARVQAPLDHVDVHVRHQWPPNLSPPDQGRWVVIQPWEFGSLPQSWVEVFAAQVDEMWVPSTYVKQVYVDSGVPAERVVVIPNGFDPTSFHPGAEPYQLKTTKKFKFLFVGGTIFRKGIDILIDTYIHAYSRKDDVCLVIKDIGGKSFYKGQTMKEQIAAIQEGPFSPEIEYIDKTLTTEQLAGLYVTCDVLVHPYRGEGFGMPILEAMACGTPPIVTNGGAALDFCSKENSILVKARRMNYPENKVDHFDTVNTPWLYEVEPSDLAKAMKFAVRNRQAVRVLGTQAAHDALRFTWDAAVVKIRERVERLRAGTPLRDQFASGEQNPVEDAYLLAIANYQNEHYQESLNYLEVASTLLHEQGLSHDSITAFDVAMRKGDCMLKMGVLQEAKEEYEQALKIRPESAEACFNLGLCLELGGQMDGAIVMYEFAVSLNPEWKEANERLSDCHRRAESSME